MPASPACIRARPCCWSIRRWRCACSPTASRSRRATRSAPRLLDHPSVAGLARRRCTARGRNGDRRPARLPRAVRRRPRLARRRDPRRRAALRGASSRRGPSASLLRTPRRSACSSSRRVTWQRDAAGAWQRVSLSVRRRNAGARVDAGAAARTRAHAVRVVSRWPWRRATTSHRAAMPRSSPVR